MLAASLKFWIEQYTKATMKIHSRHIEYHAQQVDQRNKQPTFTKGSLWRLGGGPLMALLVYISDDEPR
jgi:hypothetical protein